MYPHTSPTAVAYRATGLAADPEELESLQEAEEGPHGQALDWAVRVSSQIAPGARYAVFAGPPALDPDPRLWAPVPVREYRAVEAEAAGQLGLFTRAAGRALHAA